MRYRVVIFVLVLVAMCSTPALSQDAVQVTSPDGETRASITINDAGRPVLSASLSDQTVLEPGKLGITVDGMDLGEGVTLLDTSTYTVDQRYQWRGDTDRAHNHASGRKITFRHNSSGQNWILDVRAYDTGVGWRYVVPGDGTRRVNGEVSTFVLPSGTELWYQSELSSYEGNFRSTTISEGANASTPNRVPLPATGELPGGGYVTLAESDVLGYSGSSLVSRAPTEFQVDFHDDQEGWEMEGRIHSAWRTAIIARNLNELVNSNLVEHLAPAPNDELFPEGVDTDWVEPGRSWWTWFVHDIPGSRWDRQKQFVDNAAKLNAEYHLVDAGWEGNHGWGAGNRDRWDRLEELTGYAEKKDVGIWVWTASFSGRYVEGSPGLETPEKRKRFFRRVSDAGAVGVKVDFF